MVKQNKLNLYDSGSVVWIGTQEEADDWANDVMRHGDDTPAPDGYICTLEEYIEGLQNPDSDDMHKYTSTHTTITIDLDRAVEWLLGAEMNNDVKNDLLTLLEKKYKISKYGYIIPFMVSECLDFNIYVYLNNPRLALDDRTATGVANAMRVSKDTAGDKLNNMVENGLIEYEPVGNSKVYFVKVTQLAEI